MLMTSSQTGIPSPAYDATQSKDTVLRCHGYASCTIATKRSYAHMLVRWIWSKIAFQEALPRWQPHQGISWCSCTASAPAMLCSGRIRASHSKFPGARLPKVKNSIKDLTFSTLPSSVHVSKQSAPWGVSPQPNLNGALFITNVACMNRSECPRLLSWLQSPWKRPQIAQVSQHALRAANESPHIKPKINVSRNRRRGVKERLNPTCKHSLDTTLDTL